MSFNLAEYVPALRYKSVAATTWGAGGNTCTITDSKLATNSVVQVFVTGATPAIGRWSYAITQGQLVITSSDPENTALPISYIIL